MIFQKKILKGLRSKKMISRLITKDRDSKKEQWSGYHKIIRIKGLHQIAKIRWKEIVNMFFNQNIAGPSHLPPKTLHKLV